VKAEAMQRGLMCYPMGGTIDGVRGDHVLLAPPFIATRSELDQIVERTAARSIPERRRSSAPRRIAAPQSPTKEEKTE
jgi:adenosylmethionine-8-amino-7-oxononanoate aminotransferase